MATNEKTWNVANRLHSNKDSDNPQTNHIIAGADEIFDDDLGKKQNLVNFETNSHLSQLDETTETTNYNVSELEERVHAVEEHEQIVIEGGTLEVVNTPEDIKEGSGAVATGNALANAYGFYIDNPEWVRVITDRDEKILFGIKTDGDICFGVGIPSQIKDYVDTEIAKATPENYLLVLDFLEGMLGGKPLSEIIDDISAELDTKVEEETTRAIQVESQLLDKISEISKKAYSDEEEEIVLSTDSGKEITSIKAIEGSDDSEVMEFTNDNGSETYAKIGEVDGKKGIFTANLYDLNGNPYNAFEIDVENDILTIGLNKYKLIRLVETD